MTRTNLRFMLLQVRNADDPMRQQEVDCFAQSLCCDPLQVEPWDLLYDSPDRTAVSRCDAVLIGGSGHYSVVSDAPWLDEAFELLREIHREGKPTFASCWGFQAMARALGGHVVHDLSRAEVGTHTLRVTSEGSHDPLFSSRAPTFRGQMGHEDRVDLLPDGAVLLASSSLVENQAYRFEDKPIWCTQFHPELGRLALLERVLQYPKYIEKIAGMPAEQFEELLEDAPETESLLQDFVQLVLE